MINEINQELNKLREDIALKNVLENKLKTLEVQLSKSEKDLRELKKALEKEHRDLEKLEKISFTNIIATIMKNKDEKIEKEQQEYLMVKIKYDESSSKVELLKENIQSIKDRLLLLRYCENEYKSLISKKLDYIKSYGEEDKKNKIFELEEEINKALREKKEIEEAQSAGKELLRAVNAAKNSLESAKNWGIFDIAGGEMISSIAKHNKINEAESQFRRVSSLISRFNKELGDVRLEGLTFSSTTITFDIFFDNIFTDFSVQNKINNSLDKVRNLIGKVESILSALEGKKEILNTKISIKRKEYDSLIENI